jgi:hypothetical protein
MIFYIFILLINNSFLPSFVCLFKYFSENSIRHFSSNQTKMILGMLCCLACLILKQLYILSNQNDKITWPNVQIVNSILPQMDVIQKQ